MRRQPPPPMPAAAIPTVDGMFSVWRADRCVQDASAHNYIRWIKWFRFYVNCLGLEERAELTQEGACRFAEWYGRHRRVDHKKMARAQTALHALNRVYQVMGLLPPKWSAPRPPVRPASALLQEYADYLARHRGSPPVTVQKRLTHVGRLLEHLADRDKTWSTMALADIDAFLVDLAQRFARATVADIAGSVRSFSRFLLATERTSVALADSVISPVPPRFERPRRSLPWEDVQHLLRAVDTSTARGLRDYALLLLMSTYGLGAGETIRLHIVVAEDVGQERRLLDGRKSMFRHVNRWIVAATEQAKLPHDAELVAQGDGLAPGGSRAPSRNRIAKFDFAVIAPSLCDKANETGEDELSAPIGDSHRPLEAQELLRVPDQTAGSHHRHVGTGNEMSRSVSVAIRT